MKIRLFLIKLIFFIPLILVAQPSEVTYLGNVIKSGYAVAESYGPYNIGFNFTFYSNSYNQFYVNSSGQVLFGAGSIEGTESPIPTAAAPNNFIAPLWDQLIISSSGKMLYATVGAAPNRKLIIQGTNMGFYPYPIFMGTYIVILYETSNKIQVQYRIIVDATSARAHGESATIGIENSTGTAGVQYAYHNPSAISTGQAISFTPAGPTYTMNSNDIYDGVVLATNLTLPEPGIPFLQSPPQDAVIGSNFSFEWSESSYAASYNLLISQFSDLGGAASYPAGNNLSYDVTGLTLGTTYYWGVFATNATGTTWCEIKRFTTSATPPLAAVPQTAWVEQSQDKSINLNYTGGDVSPKTAIITSLPAQGTLWQYNAGAKGTQITAIPASVSDPGRNVIYTAPATSGNAIGNFNYKMNDAGGDSPEATIIVNVSPPGIPGVLSIAKGTGVEIQFDRQMSDPTGKHGQFTVTVNGTPATMNSAALKTGDPYTIALGLSPGLTGTETVLVSYTQGDVTSSAGGFLLSFTDQSVTLRSQTISFTQTLDKKFNESPFNLTATASSGLGMTYSSSALAVATISTNVVTLNAAGTSDITARQAGNATWAPAKYIRTLAVTKADQTITFGALPDKEYGAADFTLTAVAGSLLLVEYLSSNLAVATVSGNTVHIVGAGSTIITASQGGSTNWNPAPDVPQSLTVNKADQTITFGPLLDKTFGDPDFQLFGTASSGLSLNYVSSNPSVATVTGNTIHIVAVGTSTITASQPGDANYNAASDVAQPLNVYTSNATVSLGGLSAVYDGLPHPATATTVPAGLTILFTYDGSSLPPVNAGSYTVEASVSDASYHGSATGTLVIDKGSQTITFGALPDKVYGDEDFTLTAVAGSSLLVEYVSSNLAVATVEGNTVHIVGAGTTTITASQAGDANWNAAPEVTQELTVNKAEQTITFGALPDKVYGDDDFNLTAVAGSSLLVEFVSSNLAVATLSGNTVHIVGAGTTTITASQEGNEYYNPAPDIQQSLTVQKAVLRATAENKSRIYNTPNPGLTYTITGFVNSETESVLDVLPVISTVATQSSSAGTYPINLSGADDNNYTFIYIAGTLTIERSQQVITINDLPEKLLVKDTYLLDATSTSSLPVQFESLDTDIATVSGDQLTGVSAGTVTIRAFHPGDQNYYPAEATGSVEVYSTHKDIMHLFTPNNDGINDYWELPLNAWGKCEVRVFSRSGKPVYSNPDYDNRWDGTSNGGPLPEGAYYYVIETELAGSVKGTVNLVR